MTSRSYHSRKSVHRYISLFFCVYALIGMFEFILYSSQTCCRTRFSFSLSFYSVSHSLEHYIASVFQKPPRCNSRWPPHWLEMILERGVDFLLRRKIFRRLRSHSHTCHHVMDCLCPKAKRGRSIRQSSSSRCTRCIVAATRNIRFDWPYCSSSSRSIRLWFFMSFFFRSRCTLTQSTCTWLVHITPL